MKKMLYIIGPVTGKPDNNIAAFEAARKTLCEAGYDARIPQDFIAADATHEEAMRISLSVILKNTSTLPGYWLPSAPAKTMPQLIFDGLAVLEGAEDSPGATTEIIVADAIGLPMKIIDEWVDEAASE